VSVKTFSISSSIFYYILLAAHYYVKRTQRLSLK